MPTRQANHLNVVVLYGDSYLHHEGIGSVTTDGSGLITSISCGIFPQQETLPPLNAECRITGNYDDNAHEAFTADLRCTAPGRPKSTFSRA